MGLKGVRECSEESIHVDRPKWMRASEYGIALLVRGTMISLLDYHQGCLRSGGNKQVSVGM